MQPARDAGFTLIEAMSAAHVRGNGLTGGVELVAADPPR
jgi:hypothetical protein